MLAVKLICNFCLSLLSRESLLKRSLAFRGVWLQIQPFSPGCFQDNYCWAPKCDFKGLSGSWRRAKRSCACLWLDVLMGFFRWLVFVAHLNLENYSFPSCHLHNELLKEKSWWTGLDPSFVVFSLTCGFEPLFGSMLICWWCQPALENQLTSVQSKEALFQGQLLGKNETTKALFEVS